MASAGVMLAGSGIALAKPLPQLSGRPLTPVVHQPERVVVAVTASNRAKTRTRATAVTLLLSKDARRSRSDAVLGRAKLPPLGRGRARSVRVRGRLAAKTAPGRYRVLACAAKARCRVLRGSVGVGPRVERVTVALQADTARAASAPVTASGGTVDARGADGTRYRLVLPPGAVSGPVTVTMTPLTGASGLPFEGLAAGVRLEPAGLSLEKPGRLLVQRDGLAVSPTTAAFGSEDGRDLFLTPWTAVPEADTLGPGTIGIGITHFSGWGVVSLNQTQLAAQYARSAFNARDRIAQEAREALEGDDDGVLERDQLPLQEMLDQVVKPLAEAAIQDPTFLDDAVGAFLSIERQLQLLGIVPGLPEDPALASLFQRAFMRYVQVLKARCAAADFTAIGDAVSLARQIQLAGMLIPGMHGPPQSIDEALELLDPCLRFELRMTSTHDFRWDFDFGAVTRATLKLHVEGGKLVGAGPLAYDSATFGVDNDDCTEEVTAVHGSTMVVEGGADLLALAPPGAGKPAAVKPRVAFVIDPGTPTEDLRLTCPADPDPPHVQETKGNKLWLTLWAGCTHPDPTESLGLVRTIEDFTATGTPGLLAERVYAGSFPCPQDMSPAAVQERWQLVHTPQKQ
jgi:hypothetical protein